MDERNSFDWEERDAERPYVAGMGCLATSTMIYREVDRRKFYGTSNACRCYYICEEADEEGCRCRSIYNSNIKCEQ